MKFEIVNFLKMVVIYEMMMRIYGDNVNFNIKNLKNIKFGTTSIGAS